MSFAVPKVPVRNTNTKGNEAPDAEHPDGVDSTKNVKPGGSSGTFAIPEKPASKKSAMASGSTGTTTPQSASEHAAETPKTNPTPPPLPPPSGNKSMVPNAPPLKYQKPSWSGHPNQQFFFEVIKNGVIVETIMVPEKEFLVIGRLPMCDIEMEHPSLSRYHAVIQFKSNGDCYIYDMNSSHGTRLNKNRIPAGMHVTLKPGDQLKFGESTRIYLFQSKEPVDQEEEERKLVAAMIERQNRSRAEAGDQGKSEEDQEEDFNWGMQEDAEDEDDMGDSGERRPVDPDAYYRENPKKALRNYLENRGYACEFEVEEEGPGHAREYTARIRLPIESAMGPVYAEATAGKRRDAERDAALDACIKLDSRGMLGTQKSSGEAPSQSRRKYGRPNDDDDDDDDFYDRTEKKKSVGKKVEQKAETHESLLEKHKALKESMTELDSKIQEFDANAATRKALEESNDLDAYMAMLEKTGGDSKAKMQQKLAAMKKEESTLLQLIEFTKPVDYLAKIGGPGPKPSTTATSTSSDTKRPNDEGLDRETETKRPRIGPSLPPPSSEH
ncbi:Kanadaptin [Lunasporangiospora selenospora]|uniref:Kanadaptin n=1 Tax=Lunasporangiospora selenospora TaxID=979761 RepID=A0A9P6KI43_9FUNG|nr:Kanadaptin [Lunasporangiospora selenospora]